MNTAAAPATLQKQVVSMQETAKTITICSAEDYVKAGELSRAIAQLRKQVDETFDPIIRKAHEAHKEAIDQKKRFSLPLEMNQREIDQKMLAWNRQQEEIRRRHEQELAEQKRKEAEEQALRDAEELARQGEAELADQVVEQAIAAPAPVVSIPTAVPKLEGIAKRVVWRWRVKDEKLVPREYLKLDDVKIGGVVRALKDKTNIPGVQVYSEDAAIHRS